MVAMGVGIYVELHWKGLGASTLLPSESYAVLPSRRHLYRNRSSMPIITSTSISMVLSLTPNNNLCVAQPRRGVRRHPSNSIAMTWIIRRGICRHIWPYRCELGMSTDRERSLEGYRSWSLWIPKFLEVRRQLSLRLSRCIKEPSIFFEERVDIGMSVISIFCHHLHLPNSMSEVSSV